MDGGQLLETRLSESEDTEPETLYSEYQYVWSLRCMDAPVLRYENKDADDDCTDGQYDRFYYGSSGGPNSAGGFRPKAGGGVSRQNEESERGRQGSQLDPPPERRERPRLRRHAPRTLRVHVLRRADAKGGRGVTPHPSPLSQAERPAGGEREARWRAKKIVEGSEVYPERSPHRIPARRIGLEARGILSLAKA